MKPCKISGLRVALAGPGEFAPPGRTLAFQTMEPSYMVDRNMPPVMGDDKPISYQDFCAGRHAMFVGWIAWLSSQPPAFDVTVELMATQAMLRTLHDEITGRLMLPDVAETVE